MCFILQNISKLIRTPLNGSIHCTRNNNYDKLFFFCMLIELNAFCDISPSVFAAALLIRNYPHWKEEKHEAQKSPEFSKLAQVVAESVF